MSDPPTSAAELLDALVTRGIADEARNLPGAERTVRLRIHGVLAAHVRLKRAKGSASKKLERFWKDRVGNTPLRVVAFSDDPDPASAARGALHVFGPLRGTPLRALPAGILLRLLRDADRQDSGLGATRHLAAALARYDRSELPGLLVRGLLTTHTLTERFRRSPQWENAAAAVATLPAGRDWDETLRAFGYSLESLPDRGWLARAGNTPAAVILPRAPGADLAQLDADGRPPEGRLVELCKQHGAPYGLLASGSRLRLFDAGSSAATSEWIELDTSALLAEDRPYLAALSPRYLTEGGFGQLQSEARDYGAQLWKRLDLRIRDRALPDLARGLDGWAAEAGFDTSDEARREELRHASLTLLFRLMFLLYAESAGFLPVGNPVYRGVYLTGLVGEARDTRERLGKRSTALWSRFRMLVEAMREGNPAWGVPAYNGALFHPSALPGAALLEDVRLTDPEFAGVLIALGFDDAAGRGVDYSSLEIGHLGHIYEALLSLNLSITDQPVRYDPRKDQYRREHRTGDIPAGALLWQTNEGGRKAGGVYYTPTTLVRHLVDRTVRPAYREHLARVEKTAISDPERAAEALLDFAVVDPACGSGHFLVQVVDALADEAARFLARCPLPALARAMENLREGGAGGEVEDMALLRRLLVKHSVFGVDVSPMGAEIATLSLWLAAFVPGLSLSYLGRNIVVGNSLFGVVDRNSVIQPGTFEAAGLEKWLKLASDSAAKVAAGRDRTPREYAESEAASGATEIALQGLRRVYDLWTAEPFGHPGSRRLVEGHGARIADGKLDAAPEARIESAQEAGRRHAFLHWPLAFPRQFHRERSGFDVVVGNPPWEKVKVEKHSFYALHEPGLASFEPLERDQRVTDLIRRRPHLAIRLREEQDRTRRERAALKAGEYESTRGDSDLYKYFCQRYGVLLRPGGYLGVVLPRSAFNAKGSAGFRKWLHRKTTVRRIDFLLNRRHWMFDTHPQYSIALVAAQNTSPMTGHYTEIAGIADSDIAWRRQVRQPGVLLPESAFGPDLKIPALRSQDEAELLTKLRRGSPFPLGSGGRWTCFAIRELDETNDAHVWRDVEGSTPFTLWKGASFGQYDPHGVQNRACTASVNALRRVFKPSPGQGQLGARMPRERRRLAVLKEMLRARVVFRRISRSTDSRTALACLVPPDVFLTDTAPYLALVGATERTQALVLGIMNSLAFDWQVRRFTEVHLDFHILDGLTVPLLRDEGAVAISHAAARLSTVDDRFSDFAAATGVPCGPLSDGERERLRVEIDARVAFAWNLNGGDLAVMLNDFTTKAVPAPYRTALLDRLSELREERA